MIEVREYPKIKELDKKYSLDIDSLGFCIRCKDFWEKVSLILNGVVHWKLIEDGADWKVFYDFLEEINPIGEKKNILLMDNAKIHHASRKRVENKLPSVKEQMIKKNIEVKYLIPYAPMLNPTELCFNLLRQQTEKQKTRDYEEMKEAIERVIDLLNKQDLSKYFRHCVNYFDKKDYH